MYNRTVEWIWTDELQNYNARVTEKVLQTTRQFFEF